MFFSQGWAVKNFLIKNQNKIKVMSEPVHRLYTATSSVCCIISFWNMAISETKVERRRPTWYTGRGIKFFTATSSYFYSSWSMAISKTPVKPWRLGTGTQGLFLRVYSHKRLLFFSVFWNMAINHRQSRSGVQAGTGSFRAVSFVL